MKNDTIDKSSELQDSILLKDSDKNLCVCNDVLKKDIIRAINNGATSVEEIKKQTFATMGMGCCTQQVESLIEMLCYSVEENNKR